MPAFTSASPSESPPSGTSTRSAKAAAAERMTTPAIATTTSTTCCSTKPERSLRLVMSRRLQLPKGPLRRFRLAAEDPLAAPEPRRRTLAKRMGIAVSFVLFSLLLHGLGTSSGWRQALRDWPPAEAPREEPAPTAAPSPNGAVPASAAPVESLNAEPPPAALLLAPERPIATQPIAGTEAASPQRPTARRPPISLNRHRLRPVSK